MTKKLLELARSISPETIRACQARDIAAENEAKYGGVETMEDRWKKKHAGTYTEILSGSDNGGCTTRRSTYFRLRGKK